MKFTTTSISFGLALTAAATPTVNNGASPVERDTPSVSSYIASIDAEVQVLDGKIKDYTSGTPTAIQSASDAIVSITNAGAKYVEGQASMTSDEAFKLVDPITALAKDIKQDITDLIAKKDALVAAGAGAQTYNDLTEQDTAAKDLASAIQAKVPTALAGIASSLAAQVTLAIESGISAFEDVKSSSGASSPATTAAATTTGASSPAGPTGTTEAATTYPASTTASTPAGTGVVPTGTGSVTGSTTTSPPFTTGAASLNGVSGMVGAAAAVVAMFAL